MAGPDGVVRLAPSQKELAVETLTGAFGDDVLFEYVFSDLEYRMASLRRLWGLNR